MGAIAADTPVNKVAALVSQALDNAGITATLSGGGAVSIYSANEYKSHDLDFVTSEGLEAIGTAIASLGFARADEHARQVDHPESQWYVEFPPGPLAFGVLVVDQRDIPVLDTEYGPLRVVTPTQIIMDRLAAYLHWNDGQSWDQAVMVAKQQEVDWQVLEAWAANEGVGSEEIARLKNRASR